MKAKPYKDTEWTFHDQLNIHDLYDKKLDDGAATNSTKVFDTKNSVDAKLEAQRNKEPLFYCKWITARPKTAFSITLGMAYFLTIVTFVLVAFGYDILPIVFDTLPLSIEDNKFYLRGRAWEYRDQSDRMYERGTADKKQKLRSQLTETIQFLYEEPNGNVFTQKKLKAMKDTEDDFFYSRQFQNDFCYMVKGECAKPASIMQFFDGTFSWLDPRFNDTEFQNFTTVLFLAKYYNETKRTIDFLLPTHAVVEEDRAIATIVRSAISIGWPLEGYDDDAEDIDAQQIDMDKYLYDEVVPLGDKYHADGVGGMDFYFLSNAVGLVIVKHQGYKDLALLSGGVAFIFLIVWFQTRSLFLTTFAVMSIVTSFFIANMIYRIILDYRYLGFFHVIALFIILGIGADDVFVFYDTWRETANYKFRSLAHRVSYAYRRSALAMLSTSLTTAVAFAVSAASPFIGMNTFGVFAGLLVLVNYMSVIIFFPTAIVIYHLYFEQYGCCCCCSTRDTHTFDTTEQKPLKRNIIVHFFAEYYFKFITHTIIRWIIVGVFVTFLTVSIYFATTIQVQQTQIQILPSDSNFEQFVFKRSEYFDPLSPVRVYIVWGLKEQDVSGCHKTDEHCVGKTVWDESFNIQSEDNQQALLEFCETLRTLPKQRLDELHIKIDAVTGEPEVHCFPKLMKQFLEEEQERIAYNPSTNAIEHRYPINTELHYPVTQNTSHNIMNNTGWIYSSSLDENYDRWFEIAMSHWLYNGFQAGVSGNTFEKSNGLLGVSRDTYSVESTATQNGYLPYPYVYGTKLRYAAIVVNTTLKIATLGYVRGIPIRDKWEEFISAEIKKMPPGLNNAFQCTPIGDLVFRNQWHWLDIQKTLVTSSVIGIVVGLCCALPVLILVTMNVVIGIMATVNMALITATVVGFIPLMGWELGFIESLNLVLVVGLSVDYCVHLAEGYSRSIHHDRKDRLHDALREVGISVISGCVTSMGASLFLFFAVIVFFNQFGIFLFATLGIAFIYSIGFFCTCLGIFGPQGNFGSLQAICAQLCGSCRWFKKRMGNKPIEWEGWSHSKKYTDHHSYSNKRDHDRTVEIGNGKVATRISQRNRFDFDRPVKDATDSAQDRSNGWPNMTSGQIEHHNQRQHESPQWPHFNRVHKYNHRNFISTGSPQMYRQQTQQQRHSYDPWIKREKTQTTRYQSVPYETQTRYNIDRSRTSGLREYARSRRPNMAGDTATQQLQGVAYSTRPWSNYY